MEEVWIAELNVELPVALLSKCTGTSVTVPELSELSAELSPELQTEHRDSDPGPGTFPGTFNLRRLARNL
jgi:hypothetical protein